MPPSGVGMVLQVRMNEPVIAREPRDRPFDRTMLARLFDAAGEDLVGH